MRRVLAAVLAFGLVHEARAADMPFDLPFDIPVLRGSSGPEIGPPAYHRWSGFYFGGQAGYSAASLDFGNSTSDLIAFILRDTALENQAQVSQWTVLPGTATSATGFGGFVGYNAQWEDVVLGLELNYDRSDLRASASDTIVRSVTVSTGVNDVQLTSQASFRLQDYVTARVRGGWNAGWFMPYAFGAVAVARVDVASSATVNVLEQASGATLDETRSETADGAFAYGWAAGLGLDFALMSNIFLRAEWEYLKLTYSGGYDASINTIRAGVGLKF